MKILVIDDSDVSIKDIINSLNYHLRAHIKGKPLLCETPFLLHNTVEHQKEQRKRLTDQESYKDIDIILLDYVLKFFGNGDIDYDYVPKEILPLIRKTAPWIPVISVSAIFKESLFHIVKMSSDGYDAIVPKSEALTNEKNPDREELTGTDEFSKYGWSTILEDAYYNRMSRLLGKDSMNIRVDLEDDNLPTIVWPITSSENQISENYKKTIKESLSIAGFSKKELTIGQIHGGFSGAEVYICNDTANINGNGWLLKVSKKISSLHREIKAHRKLFESNLPREYYVPALHHNVIVRNSVGIILYEFEEGAKTLHEADDPLSILLHSENVKLFQKMYGGDSRKTMCHEIFNDIIEHIKYKMSNETYKSIDALMQVNGDPGHFLNSLFTIDIGRQHGDLHARNLLVKDKKITAIDFSHYQDKGYPLLDFFKLQAHLIFYSSDPISSLRAALNGECVKFRELADIFCSETVRDDENYQQLLKIGLIMFSMPYLLYDDPELPKESKNQIDQILLDEINKILTTKFPDIVKS